VPVLLYKLYGARTILNTIIQSLTPHNSMLNMSLVRHSVTRHRDLNQVDTNICVCFVVHFVFCSISSAFFRKGGDRGLWVRVIKLLRQ